MVIYIKAYISLQIGFIAREACMQVEEVSLWPKTRFASITLLAN